MTDLAPILWPIAVVLLAVIGWRASAEWARLLLRRIELTDEHRKQVDDLARRFSDVEKTANWVKTEWINSKLVRGNSR